MEYSYLDPQKTILEQAPDGTLRLTVRDELCALRAQPVCAFPLSHPREHIVLRDGGGRQVGVLRRLDDLGQQAAALLQEQLERRYFLPRISFIHDISERFGSSVWDLETDRGRHTVTTRQMNEAVHEVEPGRYIITDVEENRFEIRNLAEMDAASRARFLGKI